MSIFSGLKSTKQSLAVAEYLTPIAWLVGVKQGLTSHPQVPHQVHVLLSHLPKAGKPRGTLGPIALGKKKGFVPFPL